MQRCSSKCNFFKFNACVFIFIILISSLDVKVKDKEEEVVSRYKEKEIRGRLEVLV